MVEAPTTPGETLLIEALCPDLVQGTESNPEGAVGSTAGSHQPRSPVPPGRCSPRPPQLPAAPAARGAAGEEGAVIVGRAGAAGAKGRGGGEGEGGGDMQAGTGRGGAEGTPAAAGGGRKRRREGDGAEAGPSGRGAGEQQAGRTQQEAMNKASRFQGVSKQKGRKSKPWKALVQVTEDGKSRPIYIATFAREEDAARAFDRVSIAKLGHTKAKTNYPVAEYRAEWGQLEALGKKGAAAREKLLAH